MTAIARQASGTANPAAELLELFYPVHYKGGMALEDAMRGGRLSRKQVAILWLIRSEGGQGRRMRRKEIERLRHLMENWEGRSFECGCVCLLCSIRSCQNGCLIGGQGNPLATILLK